MPDPIEATVFSLADACVRRGLSIAVAESCTGGWIAKCCTDLAGSSRWFERGFVTYSNEAKAGMLGVAESSLQQHGAVSEAVVLEMARGALDRSRAAYALAVSGIAGPGGGTPGKPVGTVWIAWAGPDGVEAEHQLFDGDRAAIRRQTVEHALAGLLARLET